MWRRYRTDRYIATEDHYSALPNQQSVLARPKFVADALEQAKVTVPTKQIRFSNLPRLIHTIAVDSLIEIRGGPGKSDSVISGFRA